MAGQIGEALAKAGYLRPLSQAIDSIAETYRQRDKDKMQKEFADKLQQNLKEQREIAARQGVNKPTANVGLGNIDNPNVVNQIEPPKLLAPDLPITDTANSSAYVQAMKNLVSPQNTAPRPIENSIVANVPERPQMQQNPLPVQIPDMGQGFANNNAVTQMQGITQPGQIPQPKIDLSSVAKQPVRPIIGGQPALGNIDLTNRPQVKNADGSISTVRSKSFNFDGKEVLLPTVSDDGRIMTDQEAINQYKNTGRNLGIFNSPEEADKYAQQLHEQQAQLLDPNYRNKTIPQYLSPEEVTTALRDKKAEAMGIMAQYFGKVDPNVMQEIAQNYDATHNLLLPQRPEEITLKAGDARFVKNPRTGEWEEAFRAPEKSNTKPVAIKDWIEDLPSGKKVRHIEIRDPLTGKLISEETKDAGVLSKTIPGVTIINTGDKDVDASAHLGKVDSIDKKIQNFYSSAKSIKDETDGTTTTKWIDDKGNSLNESEAKAYVADLKSQQLLAHEQAGGKLNMQGVGDAVKKIVTLAKQKDPKYDYTKHWDEIGKTLIGAVKKNDPNRFEKIKYIEQYFNVNHGVNIK